MRTLLAIAVAGALGVLARHLAQNAIGVHSRFPWATFIVNVSGAFAAGFFFTVIGRRFSVPMWVQSAIFVGFLGGYTTFSAMTLDAYLLIERGQDTLAFAYSAGSVVAGLIALSFGVHVARAV
jgi:fluoride exporter